MVSTSLGDASAKRAAVGNLLKSWGVTEFTRASVHWADKITAISN